MSDETHNADGTPAQTTETGGKDGTTTKSESTVTKTQEAKTPANGATQTKIEPEAEISKSEHDQIGYLKRKLQETADAQAKMQSELEMERREKNVMKAVQKYELSEDDAEFITGKTPDEIETQAKKLRERYDSVKTEITEKTKSGGLKTYEKGADTESVRKAKFESARRMFEPDGFKRRNGK